MKKIKIMHLIHQLRTGGAENGIINLVNSIDGNRFESAVCAFVGGGAQTKRVDARKTKLIELNKTKNGNDFLLPFRLKKQLDLWQPHILHTHAWGTLCEGFLAAKMARVPVIVHGEHGTIQQQKRNIPVQRFVWGLCTQVLSVSNSHRGKIAATVGFSPDKIKVIPNGVDTGRFCPSPDRDKNKILLGFTPQDRLVGTVGRLVPVKDQQMLIQAFATFVGRYPDAKLILVGDGPLRNELTHLTASLEITEHVHFLGRRSDVPAVLQAMDLFVLPSISEGMSNTILEAMSCGLPVVATNVGGNPEIIVNNVTGRLVQSGDVDELASVLTFLFDHPDRLREMGNSSRKHIEDNYSIRTMINNYERLYQELYQTRVSGE